MAEKQKKIFQEFKVSLIPLTPIHIGTGEFAYPGDYFIFNQDQNILFFCDIGAIPPEELGKHKEKILSWISSDPHSWVKKVDENTELCELLKKYSSYSCKTTTDCFGKIKSRWGTKASELAIARTFHSIKGPYIPGSSIKGAIRTALVYSKAKNNLRIHQPNTVPREASKRERQHLKPGAPNKKIGCRQFDEEFIASKWERQHLKPGCKGDIQDDILSSLKVSDSSAARVSTWVLLPEHLGMQNRGTELQDYRECFVKANFEKPYSFSLSIRIDNTRDYGFLSKKAIMDACNQFYLEVLKAEKDYWLDGNKPIGRETLKKYEEIESFLKKNPDGVLLRLGWGCGMNSVGVNIAKPSGKHPVRGKDDRYRYYPNTRILLAGYPPGWALLKIEEV